MNQIKKQLTKFTSSLYSVQWIKDGQLLSLRILRQEPQIYPPPPGNPPPLQEVDTMPATPESKKAVKELPQLRFIGPSDPPS